MPKIPENIQALIGKIKDGEFRWKVLHTLAWKGANELEKYKGTEIWEKDCIEIHLTASKKYPVKNSSRIATKVLFPVMMSLQKYS